MHKKLVSLTVLSLFVLPFGSFSAQAATCSQTVIDQVTQAYCKVGDAQCWKDKGGDSVAYIQSRIPGAPTGVPSSWTPNLKKDIRLLKAGDVAIFTVAGSSAGHVAYIETVETGRGVITISEYNWGECAVDAGNGVNSNYHKKTNFPRKLNIKDPTIRGFWRK